MFMDFYSSPSRRLVANAEEVHGSAWGEASLPATPNRRPRPYGYQGTFSQEILPLRAIHHAAPTGPKANSPPVSSRRVGLHRGPADDID